MVRAATLSPRRTQTETPRTVPDAVDTFLDLVRTLRLLQLGAGGDRSWCALDISMAELKAVVLLVHTGGLTAQALAGRLDVSPSAITMLVDRLVADRLARRERDETDRRRVWIRPAPKAHALLEALNRTSRSVVRHVLRGLPAAQRKPASDALRALLASAQRVLAEKP